MKIKLDYKLIFLMILIIFINPGDIVAQCAMCKEAAATSLKANPNGMARSLNSGILYLMVVPYLMILFIFRKQVLQLWKHLVRKFSKKVA
jgi:hypothetical protein